MKHVEVDFARAQIKQNSQLERLMHERVEHYQYTMANAAQYALQNTTEPLHKRLNYIDHVQHNVYPAAKAMLKAIYHLELHSLWEADALLDTVREWKLAELKEKHGIDQYRDKVEVDDEDENNFDRYNFENYDHLEKHQEHEVEET